MPTIDEQLTELVAQKNSLAANLNTMGVTASESETLNTLVPKVLDIPTGGGAVVQPLSVAQNGTYNPPSGVDGFSPVTVNVSGGGGAGLVVAVATASSTHSIAYSVEKAFEGGFWGSNGDNPAYLRMDFQSPVKITGITFGNTMLGSGNLHWSSSRVVFQASNDGTAWTDLYDAQNLSDDPNNLFTYAVQNNNAYLYYRFVCYKGNFYTGIGNVQISYNSGSSAVQPLSVTQNGTYNPPSGVDGYAPVTVNVSGGGATPGLPNSIQANILSSAYLGNFVDISTPWDGFVFFNGANAFASQNYMYLASNSYLEYDLGSAKDVTVYFVGTCTDRAGNYPTLFGLIYAASASNVAVVNSYNGVAHFSRYGSELSGMPVISTLVEHCWTIAINAEAKTAKLYADGQYIGVLTLSNVGQYIRVATVAPTSYQGNVLVDYLGVVEGEEAAETIVANQQSLMTVFGIE